MKMLIALVLFSSCGVKASLAIEPQDGEATPWCFRLMSEDDDGAYQASEHCFQFEPACAFIRGKILEHGGRIGVVAVGNCMEWP